VIGAGGVTSYFLPAFLKTLAHYGGEKPRVYIMDGDALEERNLERQLFSREGITKNKAEALVAQYKSDYTKLEAIPKFFLSDFRPREKSLLFVFVDNHPARRNALSACDRFECAAIVAANEYTDAQAYFYDGVLKNTRMDPRVRYPEILTDESGDPARPGGCTTGEALAAAPQLPIANLASAHYALQLFWFRYAVAPGMELSSMEHWPVEHSNNFNKMTTRTEGFYASAV
jgi:hypothetical protein